MIDAGLIVFAAALVAFSLACLVRWALAVRALRADAADEYAGRARDKPASVKGVSEDAFIRLYVQSFQPRWALYAALATGLTLVLAPLMIVIAGAVYHVLWTLGGAPEWGGRIGYVFLFSQFFGMIALWALVAGVVARFYWLRAPEPWTHALARARGEPIPEESTWRRRPKWARRVRPDPEPDADS
ncbi:hypothetical protein F1654_08360 [Alkalicaulis satelles]|uniref:Uncharacterized protein n=1 Tax=Alkalicaulis satelles TaxID=2609175 RepID=A0A5M6ZGC6_9PROT|nr:hypothetical protein [Alkalicaulis satelles]KAA5803802.1 hypothetical protein F1654_08360 [Alkalicaulis satelles]